MTAAKKYAAVFRIRFINTLQYRAAALAGIATQFAWGFMEVLLFMAFYQVNPAAFPMELSHTVSYLWLRQSFLFLFMMWFFEYDIIASITQGNIAYDLVRPVDLYTRWFCQICANRLARAALRCSPILIVAFLLPEPLGMVLPANFGLVLVFLFSMALGLLVLTAFSMFIYISLFFTMSPAGVRTIFAVLVDFLSGAIIPIPFFPPLLQTIVELLPFGAMMNVPFRIYSGDIYGREAVWGIGLQIFWLVFLVFLGRKFMSKAQNKVIVQGG